MQNRSYSTLALAAMLGVGVLTPLSGCGDAEPKVMMPDHPTPPPGPESRLKPLGAEPEAPPQPPNE